MDRLPGSMDEMMARLMTDPQARADLRDRTGLDLDNFGKEIAPEQLRREFRERRERMLRALMPGTTATCITTADHGSRNAKPRGTKPTDPPDHHLLPGTCGRAPHM